MSTKSEVLEVVKYKTKNRDIDEELMSMAADEIEQVILTFCNLNKVPAALKFAWANMIVDLLNYQLEIDKLHSGIHDDDELEFSSNAISTIDIGDTKVGLGGGASYDAKDRALRSHNAYLDDLVMNYREQLMRFRRMVW